MTIVPDCGTLASNEKAPDKGMGARPGGPRNTKGEPMRLRGLQGHNDATSILLTSSLHRKMDFDRYLEQGAVTKLFRLEELDATCERPDDPYLFYVQSGAIEVGIKRDDGRKLSYFYVRGSGDAAIAGLPGYLSLGSSRLTFRAVRNTVLISFTRGQVRALMHEDDAFYDDVMHALHMSMAQLGHRIDAANQQSTSRRMLLWLEKLCEANEPDADGVYRIPCNLIVDEISGLLEIHYATCNKLLKSLKDQGIASKTKTHLEILDRAEVQRLLLEENPVLY